MKRGFLMVGWCVAAAACAGDGDSRRSGADADRSDTFDASDGSGLGDGGLPAADAIDGSGSPRHGCVPAQTPAPHASGTPYLGVHANPQNNDLVDCATASAFAPGWHALQGRGIAQPNTFSPDGATTYVTSSPGSDDPCTVFALEAASGRVRWCVAEPSALASSVAVDSAGDLYLASLSAYASYRADGVERWRVPMVDSAGSGVGATGLQLHPGGWIAAVTGAGMIELRDRSTGDLVAQLDVYDSFGVPVVARPGLAIDLETLLPEAVTDDFVQVFGTIDQLLGIFSGAGSLWTDNTVGIAPDGTIYAIGTGDDAEHGMLVQVHVRSDPGGVRLEPGWRVTTTAGSASSPSISPDGRWVKVTDGNGTAGLLDPGAVEASALLVDIALCDGNTDADPDPGRCAPALDLPLRSGPMLGASPVLDGAEHYVWDVQLAALYDHAVPDVTRYAGTDVVWETHLPGDAVWSSVITLTQNHILGTASRAEPSESRLVSIVLPRVVTSELVALDRSTGAVVLTAPVTDDSTSTVTVGPDGALYVTMLGLLSGFATETRVTGGLIRFEPR